jgi:flagella synthesis protein FlgN
MKPREAFQRIFAGMRADLQDYQRLRELLEAQFAAALEHRSEEIAAIGEQISTLAEVLDGRRVERQRLAALLVPKGTRPSISAVAERLQGASRSAFDTCWKSLESAVRDCKALNMRNCRLLMDQYEIMQRVLNAEAHTYAPA